MQTDVAAWGSRKAASEGNPMFGGSTSAMTGKRTSCSGRNAAQEGRSEMLAAMGLGIIGTIILIIVVIAVIGWFLRRA
jgi:hypothetical protein